MTNQLPADVKLECQINSVNRKRNSRLVVLLALGLVRVGAQTTTAKIDVPKLIHAAQVNGETMSKRVFEYSWKSKTLVRQYKRSKLLKEVEQDHEVYPSPGLTFVVQKLVKENGLPLSAKRAAKEQERVELELTRAEFAEATLSGAAPPNKELQGCPTFGIWTVLNGTGAQETSLGISDFLCLADFSSPRLERKDGRETVTMEFHPRGGLLSIPKEKAPFARLAGVIWIDAQDKVVNHIEAWQVDDRPGSPSMSPAPSVATIVFDDMRLPDGMWVRRRRYIDTRKDPLAFNGLNLEWKQEFTDYKRYFTEFKDVKIGEPIEQKPPVQLP